jgi:hypothetical protein
MYEGNTYLRRYLFSTYYLLVETLTRTKLNKLRILNTFKYLRTYVSKVSVYETFTFELIIITTNEGL